MYVSNTMKKIRFSIIFIISALFISVLLGFIFNDMIDFKSYFLDDPLVDLSRITNKLSDKNVTDIKNSLESDSDFAKVIVTYIVILIIYLQTLITIITKSILKKYSSKDQIQTLKEEHLNGVLDFLLGYASAILICELVYNTCSIWLPLMVKSIDFLSIYNNTIFPATSFWPIVEFIIKIVILLILWLVFIAPIYYELWEIVCQCVLLIIACFFCIILLNTLNENDIHIKVGFVFLYILFKVTKLLAGKIVSYYKNRKRT